MTSFIQLTFQRLVKLLAFYIIPSVGNVYNLFSDLITFLSIQNGVFWKIANYADAYWFLYANKKVLHETVIELNKSKA